MQAHWCATRMRYTAGAMAGQLPTRRAFRPDGQYYRTSRRLSLGRRGRTGLSARTEAWGLATLLVAVALLGFWWGHHGGWLAGILGYGVMVIGALGAVAIVARR